MLEQDESVPFFIWKPLHSLYNNICISGYNGVIECQVEFATSLCTLGNHTNKLLADVIGEMLHWNNRDLLVRGGRKSEGRLYCTI